MYFITICTQNRECLFGEIPNQDMILNDAGRMIATEWLKLTQRFPNINLGEYITMPNHFHGIIKITVGAQNGAKPQIGQPQTGRPQTGQPQGIAPTNGRHRRSIRLKGYDYSQAGLYFITICTQNRECLFGEIPNQDMVLNDAGRMIATEWLKLTQRFPNINLGEYITMPNHFHGIIKITVGVQNGAKPQIGQPQTGRPQTGQPQGIAPTVGEMIGAFKSITTNKYIGGVKQNNWRRFNNRLWQRNYWEHIIRNENEYLQISDYIKHNPAQWRNDRLNAGMVNDFPLNQVNEPVAEYNAEEWMV